MKKEKFFPEKRFYLRYLWTYQSVNLHKTKRPFAFGFTHIARNL